MGRQENYSFVSSSASCARRKKPRNRNSKPATNGEHHQTQHRTNRKPQNPKPPPILPADESRSPFWECFLRFWQLPDHSKRMTLIAKKPILNHFPLVGRSCECSTDCDPPGDYPLPCSLRSPECSPKVFRYVPASPIDRCPAVSHPDHHDDSYYKNCGVKKNINAWEARCILFPEATRMHACFAALLVAQGSSLHGWKKAEPGCEGAMHCCDCCLQALRNIQLCRNAPHSESASAKILQNGRNSSMIALRLFSGSSCDVVFASLKPSLEAGEVLRRQWGFFWLQGRQQH